MPVFAKFLYKIPVVFCLWVQTKSLIQIKQPVLKFMVAGYGKKIRMARLDRGSMA